MLKLYISFSVDGIVFLFLFPQNIWTDASFKKIKICKQVIKCSIIIKHITFSGSFLYFYISKCYHYQQPSDLHYFCIPNFGVWFSFHCIIQTCREKYRTQHNSFWFSKNMETLGKGYFWSTLLHKKINRLNKLFNNVSSILIVFIKLTFGSQTFSGFFHNNNVLFFF